MSELKKYTAWPSVPENLKTKTGLGKLGLRLAKGQEPVAVKTHWHYSKPDYLLYDVGQAIPKRKMSEKQKEALAAARKKAMTTACCDRFVGDINWRYDGDLCISCYAAKEERRDEARLERARLAASEWAQGVLADDRAIILDTETTGLDVFAQIVEITIIDIKGEPLINTLVKPQAGEGGRLIPSEAANIHGITDQDVAQAPTWPEIHDQVNEILHGASRVVIYNAGYDRGLLIQSAGRWGLEMADFKDECAMVEYAAFAGHWSDYHGSFTWQPLGGGHRALGDCLTTLERIKEMAEAE